jgi:hypothetical protein
MPTKTSKKAASATNDGKIVVENINVPGQTTRVDGAKYAAMKTAILKILPTKAPGLNQKQMSSGVVPHLPEDLFPGGAKAGWWMKCVQLDLEAKGAVLRDATKPLTWRKKS